MYENNNCVAVNCDAMVKGPTRTIGEDLKMTYDMLIEAINKLLDIRGSLFGDAPPKIEPTIVNNMADHTNQLVDKAEILNKQIDIIREGLF